MEYQVRSLKSRDLFVMARIIRDGGVDVRAKIATMARQIARADDDATNVQLDSSTIGIMILEATIEQEDALFTFLGNLTGMTGGEFAELPFDAPLAVIEQLVEQEGLVNFLSRASTLASKLKPAPGVISNPSSPAMAGMTAIS